MSVELADGYEIAPAVAGIQNAACFMTFKDPMCACHGAPLKTGRG